MKLSIILDILKTFFSAGTLIAAIIAYITYLGNKKNPDINKKRFYWDFFVPQYLDGVFKVTKDNEIIEIDLKEGRLEIENRYKNRGYNEFLNESNKINPPTYENKLVHRLSVVLERIGQAAFIGDLPLNYIFSISSKMILKDWEMAKSLEKIINNRKFARWIACTSCMYLVAQKNVELEEAKRYIKQYVDISDIFEGDSQKTKDYNEHEIDHKKYALKMIDEITEIQKSNEEIFAWSSSGRYVKKLKREFGKKMKSYK